MILLLLACAGRAPASTPVVAPPPTTWTAQFETSKGAFVVTVHPEWAPIGAARFAELIDAKLWEGARFYRVIPGFVAQWGAAADPTRSAAWAERSIRDDVPQVSNWRGTVSFAATGAPDSRSYQAFINLADNRYLDEMGFAPVGLVTTGMEVVDQIYGGYGDGPNAPQQLRVIDEGEAYLAASFPDLDRILTVARQ